MTVFLQFGFLKLMVLVLACAQNKAGSKDCNWKRFGQKCWYDDELHGIDQQVVKTIIIGPK